MKPNKRYLITFRVLKKNCENKYRHSRLPGLCNYNYLIHGTFGELPKCTESNCPVLKGREVRGK